MLPDRSILLGQKMVENAHFGNDKNMQIFNGKKEPVPDVEEPSIFTR